MSQLNENANNHRSPSTNEILASMDGMTYDEAVAISNLPPYEPSPPHTSSTQLRNSDFDAAAYLEQELSSPPRDQEDGVQEDDMEEDMEGDSVDAPEAESSLPRDYAWPNREDNEGDEDDQMDVSGEESRPTGSSDVFSTMHPPHSLVGHSSRYELPAIPPFHGTPSPPKINFQSHPERPRPLTPTPQGTPKICPPPRRGKTPGFRPSPSPDRPPQDLFQEGGGRRSSIPPLDQVQTPTRLRSRLTVSEKASAMASVAPAAAKRRRAAMVPVPESSDTAESSSTLPQSFPAHVSSNALPLPAAPKKKPPGLSNAELTRLMMESEARGESKAAILPPGPAGTGELPRHSVPPIEYLMEPLPTPPAPSKALFKAPSKAPFKAPSKAPSQAPPNATSKATSKSLSKAPSRAPSHTPYDADYVEHEETLADPGAAVDDDDAPVVTAAPLFPKVKLTESLTDYPTTEQLLKRVGRPSDAAIKRINEAFDVINAELNAAASEIKWPVDRILARFLRERGGTWRDVNAWNFYQAYFIDFLHEEVTRLGLIYHDKMKATDFSKVEQQKCYHAFLEYYKEAGIDILYLYNESSKSGEITIAKRQTKFFEVAKHFQKYVSLFLSLEAFSVAYTYLAIIRLTGCKSLTSLNSSLRCVAAGLTTTVGSQPTTKPRTSPA